MDKNIAWVSWYMPPIQGKYHDILIALEIIALKCISYLSSFIIFQCFFLTSWIKSKHFIMALYRCFPSSPSTFSHHWANTSESRQRTEDTDRGRTPSPIHLGPTIWLPASCLWIACLSIVNPRYGLVFKRDLLPHPQVCLHLTSSAGWPCQ